MGLSVIHGCALLSHNREPVSSQLTEVSRGDSYSGNLTAAAPFPSSGSLTLSESLFQIFHIEDGNENNAYLKLFTALYIFLWVHDKF